MRRAASGLLICLLMAGCSARAASQTPSAAVTPGAWASPSGLGSPAPSGLGSPAPSGLGSPADSGLGSPAPSGLGSPAPRPSSPAKVRIVKPRAGQTVSGPSVHIVLDLEDASIVTFTSTRIKPDEGHVHFYVDNSLVSMNYGLEQDLDLAPGTYFLKAEFVAADHAPFDPRVVSADVVFTVK